MQWQCYVYVTLLTFTSTIVGLKCCRKPKPLVINGTDVFQEAEGSQLLLAFVEGSNKHSRKQIRVLDLLMDNFLNMDITDIVFMGINRKYDTEIEQLRRRAENYEIIQEPPTVDIWERFGVSTNDFILLDHCGYLVAYLCYPKNLLLEENGRVCTDRLIRDTYRESPCRTLWKCRNERIRTTQAPEKESGNSAESKWLSLIGQNRDILNTSRRDPMTHFQHLLIQDDSDDV